MILIYTDNITPRVAYSFELVFESVLNIGYEITNDIEKYKLFEGNKFAYCLKNIDFESYIKANDLLFETTIKKIQLEQKSIKNDLPIFFETDNESFVSYDVFTTVFYFATRYEEYLPSELDKHQRFKGEQSVFCKNNLLQIPYLNLLIQDFANVLSQKFKSLVFEKPCFKALSTIDIDNAFAFAHKGIKRNVGGAMKDLVDLNFSQLSSRIKSNINDENDPYNTFDLIHSIHQYSTIPLTYFVLIGDYSAYDKNPHYTSKGFQSLLKRIANTNEMGLHPSYYAYEHLDKIREEKNRLENIIEKKVSSARCHFLRVNLPTTYRAFIEVGITDDYTMIYASQTGFRTGLCTPHKWFDLENNVSTNLTIHPSTIMEGTLRDYNKVAPHESIELINSYINTIKTVGGEFVSVWHNDSFTNENEGWVNVYKQMLVKLEE